MPKATFKNALTVWLSDKAPTEEFSLEVDAAGVPLALYWRKRFKEGGIAPVSKSPPPPPPAKSAASPAPKSAKKDAD